MDKKNVVGAMLGQPNTNNWEAVCAMNAAQVNALLFQQYLQDGPTNSVKPLQAILQDSVTLDFVILDLMLGPLDVSFPTLEHQQCQVTMSLVSGAVATFDSDLQIITSAILVQPNESSLTGIVHLKKIAGKVSGLGQVVVDLTSGAYQPAIKGVPPTSMLATEISTAVANFFANNATQYSLGTITASGVQACLQPTSFDVATQPAPDSTTGDGCILLLIQTNGTPGTVGPLDSYPIPDQQTAALIVSNQVIFNQLLPSNLNTQFPGTGQTFAGQLVGGVWQTSGNGGSINANEVEGQSDLTMYWTQDKQDGNGTPVVLPIDGFLVSPQSNELGVSWQYSWKQGWGYLLPAHNMPAGWDTIGMNLSYTGTAPANVDEVTDIVSFPVSASANVSYEKSSTLDDIFGNGTQANHAGSQISNAVSAALKFLGTLQLPDVHTFALANLLFPSSQVLSLQQASLPCDLLLTGTIASPLSVTPPTCTLQPGQSQQFTVAGSDAGDITWEISPNLGTIDASGLYQAPSSVTQVEVVVVKAVSNTNVNLVGSAMVSIYEPIAPTDLVVGPASLLLTSGQAFSFAVTDESGAPVEANCTVNPNVGDLEPGYTTGVWNYTAPATIEASVQVTLTATSSANPSATGVATITLQPTAPVQLTPSSATLTPGQTLQLSANSTLDDYAWQVYSTEAPGTIAATDSDNSQAIYTAPASVTSSQEVMVVAYSLSGDAVGIGLARITVNPSS